MTHRTSGFTMIELVIAILIGTILTSVALSTFSGVQDDFAIRGAKNMYATLHQRARGRAVELGQTVLFFTDMAGDSAFVFANGQITDITRFNVELDVDLRAGTNWFFQCMTPRGYADPECPIFPGFTSTTDTAFTIYFQLGDETDSLTVLPMGQLVGM